MIHQLYIRDFAVIDELDLEFGPGLNLLTGETGAGKSIIVDAIGIALGERAESEAVRAGCGRALIEAVIDVTASEEAMRALNDAGFEHDEGRIVVSREIQRTGKSQCRINGRLSTVSLLKEITDHLVDTHGQHEHQLLLRPEHHLGVLDSWCGEEAAALRKQVADGYSSLCRLRSELRQLQGDERERVRMIDLYQFQIEEISAAKLTPGEEEELQGDRIRLANAEKLHAGASTAYDLLADRGDEASTLDTLGDAVIAVQSLADIDSEVAHIVEGLQAALYGVEDAVRELRGYRDGVEFNPDRLESVQERLDLIRSLKRKYGSTIEEILAYGGTLESKLDMLMHSEERSAGLESEIAAAEAKAIGIAEKLSEIRHARAKGSAELIERELSSLSMPDAVFSVGMSRGDLCSTGIDVVEFYFSANKGESPRPLVKIASGGEMSRLMLAIKSVMAAVDFTPTLVFDEIDVGVGGRTAETIGDKLDALATKSQVFCITHLPQIACRQGDHYYIEKLVVDDRTVARVRRLSCEERVTEIARMLGGAKLTDTAVRHAKEMLKLV